MDSIGEGVGIAAIAYLIGSIPVSFLITWYVRGADVREIGEGNAGARNVFHEVGAGWGIATFLADFGKGALVALLFGGSSTGQLLLAGTFVLLGHAYPAWLGFVGGKGLATAGGFSVVLIPWAAAIAGAGAGLAWTLSRRFLPTVVVAIVVGILSAPLVGYRLVVVASILGLFVLTGVKRGLDEARMRRVEARTGWDRLNGGTRS